MIILIMGVSGSGKTTIGQIVARRIGSLFVEGDDYHSAENITKMKAGLPLNDSDRLPWLYKISKEISCAIRAGDDLVVACSALKFCYRKILIGNKPSTYLVHLKGSQKIISARMQSRKHFMSPLLLNSQFNDLESPSLNENPVVINVGNSPDLCAQQILSHINYNTAVR